VFEVLGHKTYLGYDLDISGSRGVIGHVTIQFPIGHYLFVVLGTNLYL